ncbi:dTMP kinase [Salinithrix halophila]|uniref:Thymidylate kinase n=1 Tax=Salinithrix halophila TaxID=1485204 RepID=A0ABV8JBA0_9BACL
MGWLITLEGPEGAGKSTQILRMEQYLQSRGVPCLRTREPGGTAVGDRIREVLLDPSLPEMTRKTEILLYAASRAQLVQEVIQPALRAGKVVLCDRFVDSSIAYQAYGPEGSLSEVVEINRMATGGLSPDRTYLLDLPPSEGLCRLEARGAFDRIERKGASFHERVRQGFLNLADMEPDRFQVVKADREREAIFADIRSDLDRLLAERQVAKDNPGRE